MILSPKDEKIVPELSFDMRRVVEVSIMRTGQCRTRLKEIAHGTKFVVLSIAVLLVSSVAQAQFVPDATLGSERSQIVPRLGGGKPIAGGTIRGGNLFHSFSSFNVEDGQRVYFANSTSIQNIFTRVTGTASLFLLNPNGILLGQNARLDLRGTFLGTTMPRQLQIVFAPIILRCNRCAFARV
jgi:large exoprotein involved in heme utilization and adhesion